MPSSLVRTKGHTSSPEICKAGHLSNTTLQSLWDSMHNLLINCYMPAVAENFLNLDPSQAPRLQELPARAAAGGPNWASPCQAEKRGASTSEAPPDSEAQGDWHNWVVYICFLFALGSAPDNVANTSPLGRCQKQLGLVMRN